MAIVPEVTVEYTGDGVTSSFQVPFKYLDKGDVDVTVNGTLVTTYSWVGDGSISFDTAPDKGSAIKVSRNTDLTKMQYVFMENAPFLPVFIDRDYNQLLYGIQELSFDAKGAIRTLDSIPAMTESPEERAGKVVGFDAKGNPVAVVAGEDSATQLELELASDDGASMIGFEGSTVGEALHQRNPMSDHFKRLVWQFNRKFDGYDEARKLLGVTVNLYPQGFCIDEVANEVYVSFSTSSGGASHPLTYVVYDFSTGRQMRWFIAGTGGYASGFSILYEAGVKYMYAPHTYQSVVGKYNIQDNPNATSIEPTKTYDVPVGTFVSVVNNRMYVPSTNYETGGMGYYSKINIYDLPTGDIIGVMESPLSSTLNAYAGTIQPKQQGFCIGGGAIARSFGRNKNANDNTSDLSPATTCGVFLVNLDGGVRRGCLYTPHEWLVCFNKFKGAAEGSRVENESVYISESGRVYTLWVTGGTNDFYGSIIEEFCPPTEDTVDFSPAYVLNGGLRHDGVYSPVPNQDGSLIDPFTGEVYTDTVGVSKYMQNSGIRMLTLSANNFSTLKKTDGSALASNAWVTFYMWTRTTWQYVVQSNYDTQVWYLNLNNDGTVNSERCINSNHPDTTNFNISTLPDGVYNARNAANNPAGHSRYGVVQQLTYTDGDGGQNLIKLFFGSPAGSDENELFITSYIAASGVWNPWVRVYTTGNTTVDSGGAIVAASPVVRIGDPDASTRSDFQTPYKVGHGFANYLAKGVQVSHESTGVYSIKGSLGLAKEGWQVRSPVSPTSGDRDYLVEATEDTQGSIEISLYSAKYEQSSGGSLVRTKGNLVDVPLDSWVDVRLDSEDKEEEGAQ